MCDFCENIITNEKYDSLSFIEKINLPYVFIMKNNISNQYHLWTECDDSFYSGICVNNIKYCPKCGRELK